MPTIPPVAELVELPPDPSVYWDELEREVGRHHEPSAKAA